MVADEVTVLSRRYGEEKGVRWKTDIQPGVYISGDADKLQRVFDNLIRNAVKAAVGLPVEEMHNPVYSGHWSIVMLHAQKDGIFRGLDIAADARASVVEEDLWVEPGDPVEAMTGANKAIGSLVMNWPSEEERDARMQNPAAWLRVLTEEDKHA